MIKPAISTVYLLQQLSQHLGLQQVNGAEATSNAFPFQTQQHSAGLLNPSYGHPIQILDPLQRFSRANLAPDTLALILVQANQLPAVQPDSLPIPCYLARQTSFQLIAACHRLIPRLCAPRHYQHGNLIAVDGCGLLILGAPGSGKSSLSLQLLQRGHRLIADDSVYLYDNGEHLLGHGTAGLAVRWLHQRQQGLIDLTQQFQPHQLQAVQRLDAVVRIAQHRRPVVHSSLSADEQCIRLAGHDCPVLDLEALDEHSCSLVENFARQQQTPADMDGLDTHSTLFATTQQEPAR